MERNKQKFKDSIKKKETLELLAFLSFLQTKRNSIDLSDDFNYKNNKDSYDLYDWMVSEIDDEILSRMFNK